MKLSRIKAGAALLLLLVSYAAYAQGWRQAPLLDPARAERVALAERVIREEKTDDAAERILAELYWQRYPDVAESPVFGRQGRLGIQGAREHYQRHGRHEGRVWGLE